jgi:RES domain-containing protein
MTTTTTMTRVDVLRALQAEVRKVDLKVDAEFQRILRTAQQVLEISDREIGDALSVSRPSVNRWMNGTNLPYNAMRKVVFSWIDAQLAAKLRTIGAAGERSREVSASAPSVGIRYAAKSRE